MTILPGLMLKRAKFLARGYGATKHPDVYLSEARKLGKQILRFQRKQKREQVCGDACI